MGSDIRRISRRDIDDQRWRTALAADATPLPYGLPPWLDTVTDGSWDALVIDDYRVVLPLPKLRRWGILPVIIRPPYTQQLGPFGRLQPGDIQSLLAAIPQRPQISLPLRANLDITEVPDRFRLRRRTNFELDLSGGWTETVARFPRKLQAFLRQCAGDVLEEIEPAFLIALSEKYLGARAGMPTSQLAILHRLARTAANHNFGHCWQLRENGDLLAAGFFPTFQARTVNLATVTTPLGRKRRGTSRLLALVMQRDAGTPGAVFDFEGSDLPGVKAFFAKFGGVDRGYYQLESGILSRL